MCAFRCKYLSLMIALETISYREVAIIVYANFAIVREGGILVLCRYYEYNIFKGNFLRSGVNAGIIGHH